VTVYSIDPIADPRWAELLRRDPRATVFHTPGWLLALRKTYGYEPVVLTTSDPTGPLANGIVFCCVKSWFTGRRLVSVPFADHCEPLVDSGEELGELLEPGTAGPSNNGWRYIELRPLSLQTNIRQSAGGFREAQTYWFHRLDLTPSANELFHGFHKDCVQRKIRRAEREGVEYQEGNSPALLNSFYKLLLLTRRRHQLPPQPLEWFRNLLDCLPSSLKIRIASKNGRPIAGILTLAHKGSLVYKYGGSDERFHKLGGMPLLLWKAIQDAKSKNCSEFDMGRSDCDNNGLITFKDHWGTARSKLTYWRNQPMARPGDRKLQLARAVFSYMPDRLLQAAGTILYKHIG
jgi:Acetyltransferase (GNAT) domain